MKRRIGFLLLAWVSTLLFTVAQETAPNAGTASGPGTVPRLIRYAGAAKDQNGKPMSGIIGITFALYKDEQGGAALWLETQNVQADALGHYSVQLGATQGEGLPVEVFTSGEARWLGVQVDGQAEQARVLLLSVPYALKASDAATIGGLPPSAFVLAAPTGSGTTAPASANTNGSSVPDSSSTPSTSSVTTTGGTVNSLPLWTTATNIQSSAITQTGSGATAKIGIGTATPGATLDIKGATDVEGLLDLPATGTATSGVGKNSQAQDFVASSYNSGTKVAVNQTFQWQAESAGNNTSSPSGTLNLLFGSGTSKPAETGLHLASNGQITFATGQTFPGTGTITGVNTASGSGLTGGGATGTLTLSLMKTCTTNQVLQWNGTAWACSSAGSGTVTSVASGAGLMGGPITGSGTLSIANGGVTNAMLLNPSLTVNAGTALTGGGPVALGGATTLNVDTTKVITGITAGTDLTGGGIGGVVTLNLDTSKVPQLAAANSYTSPQIVTESSSAVAISGNQTANSGTTFGVIGTTFSSGSGSAGVSGRVLSSGGITYGVLGDASANTGGAGFGVMGVGGANAGTGVYGAGGSGGGIGVQGSSPSGTGVSGQSSSANGLGVLGSATSTSGTNYGVYGATNSPSGYGVYSFGNVGVINGGLTIYGTQDGNGNNLVANQLLFQDNGEIASADANHRIIFDRANNILELREYGNILFSPGAINGQRTGSVSVTPGGVAFADGSVMSSAPFVNTAYGSSSQEIPPNGATYAPIATFQAPETGSYLVMVGVTFFNFASFIGQDNDRDVGCSWGNEGGSYFFLVPSGNTSGTDGYMTQTFHTFVTVNAGATASLNCGAFSGGTDQSYVSVSYYRITAIKLADVAGAAAENKPNNSQGTQDPANQIQTPPPQARVTSAVKEYQQNRQSGDSAPTTTSLLEAIQEQQQRISLLEGRLDRLEREGRTGPAATESVLAPANGKLAQASSQ